MTMNSLFKLFILILCGRTTNIDYVEDGDQLEYPVFSQSVAKDKVREKSEAILRELLERSDGALCCFTDAIPQLVYYDKKQRRRVPWNCDLEVGQRFSIKIAAYIFVSETKIPSNYLLHLWHFFVSFAKTKSRSHGSRAGQTVKKSSQ